MAQQPKGPQIQVVELPTWARVLAIVVGGLAIAAGIIVLIDLTVGIVIVVIILGFTLLFLGIERLVVGISGKSFARPPMGM